MMRAAPRAVSGVLMLGAVVVAVCFGCIVVVGARAQAPSVASGQTVTRLADGRRLLLGGEGESGPTGTAAIVDASTGAAHVLPTHLQGARSWHTATLLPTGRVLVLGGVGPDGRVVQTIEIFDPTTSSFSVVPAEVRSELPPSRAFHTATLLLDGSVLIAGGMIGSEAASEVELWEANRGAPTATTLGLQVSRYGQTAMLVGADAVALWGGFDPAGAVLTDGALIRVGDAHVVALTTRPDDEVPNGSLSVAESLPGDGALEVPRGIRLGLRFSHPIDPASATVETFGLHSAGERVPVQIAVAEEGRLAFLIPRRLLHSGTTYELNVSGLHSVDDAVMVPTTLRFTTTSRSTPAGRGRERAGAPASSEREDSAKPHDPEADAEGWEPRAKTDAWRTGRAASPWASLPPRKAPEGTTAVAGQVLRLNGAPLPDVTIQMESTSVRTDETGRFLLPVVQPGAQSLLIDGRTANRAGRSYGLFEVWIDAKAGATTVLPFMIWMPKLDLAHAVTIPAPTGDAETIVTTPKIPGLEVHIPPHSVIRDHDGNVVTEVSITPVPLDRPPVPLPQNLDVPLYFTVQPGGAYVVNDAGAGARLIYPNRNGMLPGARLDFWDFDVDRGGWYRYGQGAVTADGQQVFPDAGVAVYEFSGAMVTGGIGPNKGPVQGACTEKAGDPVDLATGLLVMEHTDLRLPDVVPLELTRTYRQGDLGSQGGASYRAFGVGMTNKYDVFMEDLFRATPVDAYKLVDFVAPDGGRIRFTRTNCTSNCSFTGAVFEQLGSPTTFQGASLVALQNSPFDRWDLTLRNGTAFTFPFEKPLSAIRDRFGNTVRVERSISANPFATRIWSPNGHHIDLTYGASNCGACVSQAQDDAGRSVQYSYGSNQRLACVRNPEGGITTFAYDDCESQNADRKSRIVAMWDPKQNATCNLTGVGSPGTELEFAL